MTKEDENMKKAILMALVSIFCVLAFSYSYAKKCEKCIQDRKTRKDRMVDIGIAHRDFESRIVHKGGKAYAVYRCNYGHVYLVPLDD